MFGDMTICFVTKYITDDGPYAYFDETDLVGFPGAPLETSTRKDIHVLSSTGKYV